MIKDTWNWFTIWSISMHFIITKVPIMKDLEDKFAMAYSLNTWEIFTINIGIRTLNKALTDSWIWIKVITVTLTLNKIMAKHIVPLELADYKNIFKKKSERFSPSQLWACIINLKDDFVPKNYFMYLISLLEEKILKEFIKEDLWKVYIWLLKSSITLSFFFIKKMNSLLQLC